MINLWIKEVCFVLWIRLKLNLNYITLLVHVQQYWLDKSTKSNLIWSFIHYTSKALHCSVLEKFLKLECLWCTGKMQLSKFIISFILDTVYFPLCSSFLLNVCQNWWFRCFSPKRFNTLNSMLVCIVWSLELQASIF